MNNMGTSAKIKEIIESYPDASLEDLVRLALLEGYGEALKESIKIINS
jgi:hypothetical protein